MTTLADLPTPCLVLDRAALDRNLGSMAGRFTGDTLLRPHMKTAKCLEVARRAAGHGRITVSTLEEIRYFAENGFDDITLAVCLTPAKAGRFAELGRGIRLSGLVDSVETARALVASGRGPLGLLIEVDCGDGRTGCDPDGDELIAIAQLLHEAPTTELRGVLTHAGQSYACRSIPEIRDVAEQERAAVVRAAARLTGSGLPCPTVSAGSTPTARHGSSFEGLTEMRPGVYMFGDLFQCAIDTLPEQDIALSVLAEVISVRSGQIAVDAGALALSKDVSTAVTDRPWGYGRLCDLSRNPIGTLRVDDVHQEHGLIRGDGLSVGDRVRILPNHACMSAAAHDRYHVVDGTSPEIIDVWSRTGGW